MSRMDFSQDLEGLRWDEKYEPYHFEFMGSKFTPIAGAPLEAYAKAISFAIRSFGSVMSLSDLVKWRNQAPLSHQLWQKDYTSATSEILFEDEEGKLWDPNGWDPNGLDIIMVTKEDNIALMNKDATVTDAKLNVSLDSINVAIASNMTYKILHKADIYPNVFMSAGLAEGQHWHFKLDDYMNDWLMMLRLSSCSVDDQKAYFNKTHSVHVAQPFYSEVTNTRRYDCKQPQLHFLKLTEYDKTVKNTKIAHQWMHTKARFLVKW